jgi:MoxR-like ATPase
VDDTWRLYDTAPIRKDYVWDVAGPAWRTFGGLPGNEPATKTSPAKRFQPVDPIPQEPPPDFYYLASEDVINVINLALRLRRPILATGAPGTGKTTLASSIAYHLRLGPPLQWLITSRSTVRDALYQYDALARVSDMNLANKAPEGAAAELDAKARDIGRYITLGPLGDALLPRPRPRVLLIDEIDKCDIDLPGDLLHVLDRGSYEIPELVRESADDKDDFEVQRADAEGREQRKVWIRRGRVECYEFPVVVITSNEERAFPPAFERRCLPIRLKPPVKEDLEKIAAAKLGLDTQQAAAEVADAQGFLDEQRKALSLDGQEPPTSQMLNLLYLRLNGRGLSKDRLDSLAKILLSQSNG